MNHELIILVEDSDLIKKTTIGNLLGVFDYFEVFIENKHYYNSEYSYDYGYGIKTYYDYFVIFDYGTCKDKYVVAIEKINNEYMEKIKKYCQCNFCSLPWFKQIKHDNKSKYCCLKNNNIIYNFSYFVTVAKTKRFVDNNKKIKLTNQTST